MRDASHRNEDVSKREVLQMKHSVPDFNLLDDVVAPKIIEAARTASSAMTAQGIRHVLIGGLAVGAWGYIRATKDADFLVGPEAFNNHAGGIVSLKPGVPISVGGVPVDLLMADQVGELDFDQEHPLITRRIPIADVELLVYLKLVAFRRRDKEDIVQLLKNGHSEKEIRKFLENTQRFWSKPNLLGRFDELVQLADEEE